MSILSIAEFTWYNVIVFLMVITVLVFVHEWGHFWVARKNKVRVEVFSIGFGPEIFGWNDKFGTRWKFSAIPLGGYVKMFGEGAEDPDDDEAPVLTEQDKAASFHFKSIGQRAAIVAAGPIVNFIFAIFLFAVLAGVIGTATPLAGVGQVLEKSAAHDAGFLPGDKIVSINDEEIKYFDDLRRIVSANPEQKLSFLIERKGDIQTLIAIPEKMIKKNQEGTEETYGKLGVGPDPNQAEFERQGPVSALWYGTQRTYYVSINILTTVGGMIAGQRSSDELAGPIGIAKIVGEVAQLGVDKVIFVMAMLSISLGLINLFPVPMLDGGHLAFYAIEAVLGRPLGAKAQEYGFRFGLVLVMMLFVFVTWNDLVRMFSDTVL
jgi:regulator of sigma E protease